jgi:hypothetical protein
MGEAGNRGSHHDPSQEAHQVAQMSDAHVGQAADQRVMRLRVVAEHALHAAVASSTGSSCASASYSGS